MSLDDLARVLSDPKRIGLDDELIAKLRIGDEDITRSRLRAQMVDGKSHVAIYLIGAWVEDCRDAVGNGEVYWWSIPMLGGADGKFRWNPLCGLPSGAPPFSVGSKSWLKSISLKDPPLLAVASPDEDIAACFVHLAFFEDDWAPAQLPPAMKKMLGALSELKMPVADADAIVKPLRAPLWESLQGKQDDFMLERAAKFLREEGAGYAAGTITSVMTEYLRAYLYCADVDRTESAGPWSLVKGQEQRVIFPSSFEAGGQLAILSRGNARIEPWGLLDASKPFLAETLSSGDEARMSGGFTIVAEDAHVDIAAWYTPSPTT